MRTWTELALRAQTGGREDLDQFVRVTYGPTRRLCAVLVDENAADDLVQETFLRMAKGIHRFRGESSAKTWLFSIAYHVCASELRSTIRRRDLTSAAESYELDQIASTHDHASDVALWDLLGYLEPERRAAFALTQIYGMSYNETARICDCAPGTVGSRVARARDDLIRIFRVEDGQPMDTESSIDS
jgi:RNA polymerase sigma-70 factor (ECF subfamily)